MVDALVSFAVKRLGDFLIREAVFLHKVKDEVGSLQNELRWMQSFLKDADQKQDEDEIIRVWVSEIQDIAYDTEDVIETFIFTDKGSIRTSIWGRLSCFGCISTKVDLYGIVKDIKALKTRVLEVSRKRESYGIHNTVGVQEGTTTGASILRDLRLTTSYADDEHVVGFEDDVQFLEAKLFLREPRRSVISILGMGGLGKTTLARKLYCNNNTQFDGHAWVCVSQEWKTRDLLERLIKSFKKLTNEELERLERLKDYDMELYLRQLLEGCRYLVVIDDVWQIEAWESLRRALPDQKNGSRIIITTRKQAVAESDQRTYVHKLRFLRPDESWQLFCKKAFPENCGACPPDMEKLGKQMMAKCGGLPLAIIVLGGLLSRKQFHEWHVVKERIWREINDGSIYISSLLALSYKDLPHELKSCFLYLGLFPEDSDIKVEKLIQLWIAEEFIPLGEGLDLEEVAENYLKELISRSLIQVVKRNWRTISTCRVHDLLLDLAVNKAKELNFLHISDETTINSAPSNVASSYRRIAFRSGFESYMSSSHSRQQKRLMLMKLLHTRFGFLRVLDLEGFGVTGEVKNRFDEAIGELIHLRYLGLIRTGIGELPESIGNLQALQTLFVTSLNRLPPMKISTNICKLKQLRHLKGNLVIKSGRLFETPLSFEELTNLQCLKRVNIDGLLRKKEGDEFVLNVFAKLRNLKILSVCYDAEYVISVQPLLNCRHLIQLEINGRIRDIPKEMHQFLPNLKFLSLTNSGFQQDPMPALEMLPNLLFLKLDKILVDIMTCSATGFPQLECLQLSTLTGVTKLQVEEGAMLRLRALTMESKESLKRTLPERLRSLPRRDALNWDWENL